MTAKNTFNHSNFKDSTSTAWHVVVQATGQIPYVKFKMYSWQAPEHVCENVMLEQHSSTTLPSTGETGITQTQSVAALLLEACAICPLSIAACLLSNATHGACLLSYDIPPCHLTPASWVIALWRGFEQQLLTTVVASPIQSAETLFHASRSENTILLLLGWQTGILQIGISWVQSNLPLLGSWVGWGWWRQEKEGQDDWRAFQIFV